MGIEEGSTVQYGETVGGGGKEGSAVVLFGREMVDQVEEADGWMMKGLVGLCF